MAHNLRLRDPREINKFNDTLHTSFVEHDIYQNINYTHNQGIYPLPTYLAQAFEKLDALINRLMNLAGKNAEEK